MKKKYLVLLSIAGAISMAVSGCGNNSVSSGDVTDNTVNDSVTVESDSADADSDDANAADTDEEDPFVALARANAEAEEERAAEANFEVTRRDEFSKTLGTLDITTYDMPTQKEDWDVCVLPVEGITDDFILGVDASEAVAIEASGAMYYDYDGNEKDVYAILAESGVNCIRLRIWNDPYDENGNGYGGGNCDLVNALEMGKRATENGMKVSIDFHYSDFWADPTRQTAPKAWKDMSLNEKRQALYDFTYDCLDTLLSEGVDVCMVQVGNETNFGMSGEGIHPAMKLFKDGCTAVRDIAAAYDKDIKTVIHFTNPANYDQIDGLMQMLESAEVEYDVLGLSYYTYWHGDFDDVAAVIDNIRTNYGKEVCLVEYAYPFTSDDGDGNGNSLAGGVATEGYASSVQSQSALIRDMCAFGVENQTIGTFYWGGIWIPVGSDRTTNMALWETYGSGWATSYAAPYDANVGASYGGSSWDNQALFGFDGKALPSLATFRYLKYGTNSVDGVDYIPEQSITINTGDELILPEGASAVYNDRSRTELLPVTWDENDVNSVDTAVGGEYTVKGITDEGTDIVLTVKVDAFNYVPNPSFEEDDQSMWVITADGSDPTDYQRNAQDAHTGDVSLHYWSESEMVFSAEQTVKGLAAGNYRASVYSQGGDFSSDSKLEFYVKTAAKEYTAPIVNAGWVNWQVPEIEFEVSEGEDITLGVRVNANARAWGTFDDFTINKLA